MKRVYKTPLMKSKPLEKSVGIEDLDADLGEILTTGRVKSADEAASAGAVGVGDAISHILLGGNNLSLFNVKSSDDDGGGGGSSNTAIINMGSWSGTADSYYSAERRNEYNSENKVANNTVSFTGNWLRIKPDKDTGLLTTYGLSEPVTNDADITTDISIVDVLVFNVSNIPPGRQYLYLNTTFGTASFESFFPPSVPPIYYQGQPNRTFYIGTLWEPIEGSTSWSTVTKLAIPLKFGTDGTQSLINSINIQSSFSLVDTYDPTDPNDYRDTKYNFEKDIFDSADSLISTSQASSAFTSIHTSVASNALIHAEAYFDTDKNGVDCIAISNPSIYALDGIITVVGT